MAASIRTVLGIAVGAVAIGVLVVTAVAFRDRLKAEPDHAAMGHDTAPSSAIAGRPSDVEVARGEVTIDPQRQQLIGVRLAPVTRETMAGVVRTNGVVRYDETRQSDVNVKFDGFTVPARSCTVQPRSVIL